LIRLSKFFWRAKDKIRSSCRKNRTDFDLFVAVLFSERKFARNVSLGGRFRNIKQQIPCHSAKTGHFCHKFWQKVSSGCVKC
jgi:hypothetical protein